MSIKPAEYGLCPSGEPKSKSHGIFTTAYGSGFTISCECGWEGPYRDTESEALEAWLNRSTPPVPPPSNKERV